MKRKVLLVVLLCALGLSAISIGNAEAGPPWYTCTIYEVGVTWNGYFIRVSCTDNPGAFPAGSYFMIDTSYGKGKEMVAAALTAWANGESVWIYLDSTAQYSNCLAVAAVRPIPQ